MASLLFAIRSVAVSPGDTLVDLKRFPDTTCASAKILDWKVETLDTLSGRLQYLHDPYLKKNGNLTFRGSQARSYPLEGRLDSIPAIIEKVWEFKTDADYSKSDLGTWGGGSGWTGQPLIHERTDSTMEIVAGSLAHRIYFIDFESGQASRRAVDVANVLKGTPSLDPEFGKLLYVGHGVRMKRPMGMDVLDIDKGEIIQHFGPDSKAFRHWEGNDSSPVVAGGFLFRPSENGTLYKYSRSSEGLKPHSLLRYRVRGTAPGVESSMAVCRNYGYFGDNHGYIICVNLDNLTPVWAYFNHDDTDATIVVEEDGGGHPYIYTATELDKQGSSGFSYFVKLDGLDGKLIWETRIPCINFPLEGGKIKEGGMFSTPLSGRGDCAGLIFTTIIETHRPKYSGEFIAVDKNTGTIRYSVHLGTYAWSSPVPFYTADGRLFILQCDCAGRMLLIEGKTGKVLHKLEIGSNFESSPVVYGNSAVVGTRGRHFFKVRIR